MYLKNVIKILVTFKPIVRFWCPTRLRNFNISLTNSIFDGRLSNHLYYLAVSYTRTLQPYDWHGLGPSQWKLDGLALLVEDPLQLNSTTRQNLTIWDPSHTSIGVESIPRFQKLYDCRLSFQQVKFCSQIRSWAQIVQQNGRLYKYFLKRMT